MPKTVQVVALISALLFSSPAVVVGQNRARRIEKPRPGRPSGQIVQDRFRITFPPNFDSDNRLTPVVYALHGYGGTMKGMESAWRDACAEVGSILIVAQGAKVVGPNQFSWSGFEDAGKMIDAAKAELRKSFRPHRFAPRVLTGMSQGAWATYSLGLRYPKTYRRLIPVVGMFKARSYQTAEGLTENEKKVMKRWRVYMMVGIKDRQELVANNRWLANQLEQLGAAVKAPFVDRTDPSWPMYQQIGHAFPAEAAERTAELVRALKFVLQPDERDRENWSRVDPAWRQHAKWLEHDNDRHKRERKRERRRPKPDDKRGD